MRARGRWRVCFQSITDISENVAHKTTATIHANVARALMVVVQVEEEVISAAVRRP
jgi:hypothetical protein